MSAVLFKRSFPIFLAALASIALPLQSVTPLSASAPSSCFGYVARSDGAVAVLDTSSHTEVASVDVGIAPYGVTVSPDGRTLYVANTGANTVSVVNTETNIDAHTIAVGSEPTSVAITPSNQIGFVTNFAGDTVSVIDLNSNTELTTINVGDGPFDIALSPDGEFAFVTLMIDNAVAVIDTASRSLVDIDAVEPGVNPIAVGIEPYSLAVAPSGEEVFVTNYRSHNVTVIDTSDYQTSAIEVGVGPHDVAFTPDGRTAYVADFDEGDVSVIDVVARTRTSISVGGNLGSVAVSPDGKFAYVTNGGGNTVTVIDTESNSVVLTIADQIGSSGVAFGVCEQPSRRTNPRKTVTVDPGGGNCDGRSTTWRATFRSSYILPTGCTRDGYKFLGWTRDPGDTNNLVTGRIRSSENLTAVWGELPAAPSTINVLANFLCRQNCDSALIVWSASSTSTETPIVAIDGTEIGCTSQGEVFGLKWCLTSGLAPGSSHTASVAWRNQHGVGPAISSFFDLL